MTGITRSVLVDAPVERVFAAVAHAEQFADAVPQIAEVEFLSEATIGVGTRFKETRQVNGRSGSTVLEVTEYVPNRRVTIVSDAGGTLWETVLTTDPKGAATELGMVMQARPHTLLARISTPMIKGMVVRGLEADLEAVKEYCER